MNDLPEAQSADDLYEPNAKAKRNHRTLAIAVAALLAIIGGFYLYLQLGSPPARKVDETRQRVMATADIVKNKDPPEVVNGDLNRQVAQLQASNADLQAQNLQLKDAAQRAESAQLEERTNGMRTIQALQEELDRRGPAAPGPAGRADVAPGAPARTPLAGGAPAPPLAPVPASGGPRAGGGAPAKEPLAEERPRRTMSIIRTSGPARAEASRDPDSDGSPPGEGTEFANRRSPAAAPANGKPGATGSGAYFSSRLETYPTGDFVPPNAYAQAQVLVGVDSATSVNSASDPKPVLFRIVGDAVSVGANGRYQKTPLTGCMVNGAAYGELSSEKVYVKLQRITCPAGNKKFSVATVEGYVTQKGKSGVRGQVVERSGGLTARAAIAGTLQGLGTTLSQNLARSQSGLNAVAGPGGVLASEKLSGSELAQGAIGGGVSNAASMLAEYYIKRAEQYQPVIEMPTGITVEIVFLSGFQIRGPQ
jgi:conjugal transfer pilus assembly protein TraB